MHNGHQYFWTGLDKISSGTDPKIHISPKTVSGIEQWGELANLIKGYRLSASVWGRCNVSLLAWPVMEELQRAAVQLMSLCRGEQNAGCERKGCFENPGKRGGGGLKMGKEGGREIVTPRRRVQRQGNERLPALHHAQGLPQSAGGRGKMPHVSALLAPLLVCMHLGVCVSEEGKERKRKGFPIYRIVHFPGKNTLFS